MKEIYIFNKEYDETTLVNERIITKAYEDWEEAKKFFLKDVEEERIDFINKSKENRFEYYEENDRNDKDKIYEFVIYEEGNYIMNHVRIKLTKVNLIEYFEKDL